MSDALARVSFLRARSLAELESMIVRTTSGARTPREAHDIGKAFMKSSLIGRRGIGVALAQPSAKHVSSRERPHRARGT